MILSAIKTAIAPYRLYAYAIAAAMLIGLSWYAIHSYNEHLRESGRQEIRAEDAKALATAKTAADAETARLQAKADQAEHSHDQELTDLRAYRDNNPIHGGLCLNQNNRKSGVSRYARTNGSNESPSSTAGDVQQMSSSDTSSSGQPEFDARGMLDLLANRADEVSGQLREWQSR